MAAILQLNSYIRELNLLSILLVRIPGAYFASALFPQTLFPMGLVSTFGSLFSDIVCVIAFIWLMQRDKRSKI